MENEIVECRSITEGEHQRSFRNRIVDLVKPIIIYCVSFVAKLSGTILTTDGLLFLLL